MCGRFSQYSSVSDLVAYFDVTETLVEPDEIRSRYNVAPTQHALVLTASPDGDTRRLESMRWGLVPRWAKDVSIGNRMINARSDRVATSNAYRSALARRRCVVPVDGFYEWAKPLPEAPKTPKRPFHFHSDDGHPLALAGLWEQWGEAGADHRVTGAHQSGQAGFDAPGFDVPDTSGHGLGDRVSQPLRTFTVLTTDANGDVAHVHDRMPVILDRSGVARWLGKEPLDEAEREALLVPASVGVLVADEVSRAVNRPSNDTAELIVPIAS